MKVQLTPRALRVIDTALKVAAEMRDTHVGVTHLLIAMTREECATMMVLKQHGVTEEVLWDYFGCSKWELDFQI